MDMAVTEEAHEQYKPDSQIVRSEQTSESMTKDANGTQGVPGALTNQPPAAGVAQPPAPNTPPKPAANGAPAAAGAAAAAMSATTTPTTESTSKQATKNYEIDRTVAYTKQPAGRLRRITVAVLIDNLRSVGKDGKPKETPLAKEQLDHINQLVKDAVGYDEHRGDSVNVVNAWRVGIHEDLGIPAVPGHRQDRGRARGAAGSRAVGHPAAGQEPDSPRRTTDAGTGSAKTGRCGTGCEPRRGIEYTSAAQRGATSRSHPRRADNTGPDPGNTGPQARSTGRQRLGSDR
jgi:hypothetical protein